MMRTEVLFEYEKRYTRDNGEEARYWDGGFVYEFDTPMEAVSALENMAVNGRPRNKARFIITIEIDPEEGGEAE